MADIFLVNCPHQLGNKLSKEISEIDQQINGYKQETEKLTVNISSLNNEVLNLENETMQEEEVRTIKLWFYSQKTTLTNQEI